MSNTKSDKVICAPFTVQDQNGAYVIFGTPLPWPGTRGGQVPPAKSTIAATVRCGDGGSYQHYPETVARAHAVLMGNAPLLEDMLLRLAEKTKRANEIQHSGGGLLPEDWAELHQLTNEAMGLLARARG